MEMPVAVGRRTQDNRVRVNPNGDADRDKARGRSRIEPPGAAQGIDVQAYAARLLEEAAQLPAATKTLSLSELDATLKELAQFSHKIPLLSDEALSRESMYSDHD